MLLVYVMFMYLISLDVFNNFAVLEDVYTTDVVNLVDLDL
jgi:hypothetical protein